VFSSPNWMRFALILNLLGTVALFYSFQATSSNFRLVTVKKSSVLGGNEQSALCIYRRAMLTALPDGTFLLGGYCPDWEDAKAAAVVNIEHPIFESIGWVLLSLGFFLQLFAIPQPKTNAQIRQELKRLKSEQRKSPPVDSN
jgi:hypothetical protein